MAPGTRINSQEFCCLFFKLFFQRICLQNIRGARHFLASRVFVAHVFWITWLSLRCFRTPFHLRFSGQDAANQSHLLCSPPGEVWQHLAGVAYEFHTLQLKAPTTQTSFYIYSWLICISFICIMNQSCVFLLFLITHLVGIVCSCYVFF